MKLLKYTQEQFDNDCKIIVKKLKKIRFGTIVAIARGGLWLGVRLSNVLSVPLTIVSFRSYKAKKQMSSGMFSVSLLTPIKDPVLLVDDIADSGVTLYTVKEWLKGHKVTTVTLFYKPRSVITPDMFVRKVDNNTWVVFPWEVV